MWPKLRSRRPRASGWLKPMSWARGGGVAAAWRRSMAGPIVIGRRHGSHRRHPPLAGRARPAPERQPGDPPASAADRAADRVGRAAGDRAAARDVDPMLAAAEP